MKSYYNPVKVITTDNWFYELSLKIDYLSIKKPLIVTTKGSKERLQLKSKFHEYTIFSDFSINPDIKDCKKAIDFCGENTFDGIVAIGGGSAMDLAKVIKAYLCQRTKDISELITAKDLDFHQIPSIFIPTTHGTGSEVTMWGTVWDMENKKKYSISHPNLYPTFAILDGSLSLSLPLEMSIITSMDALSHSFEALWNKNANFISNELAIRSVCKIINNLRLLKDNPSNLELRNKLLKASAISGLAFSNTKTAASHSISYPLTIRYGIPHGIASSLSLIPLLDINKPFIEESLIEILMRINVTMDELKKIIFDLTKDHVPFSLNEWGIAKKDIPSIVEESFTKGRMDNNIVDLSKDDVFSILNNIY